MRNEIQGKWILRASNKTCFAGIQGQVQECKSGPVPPFMRVLLGALSLAFVFMSLVSMGGSTGFAKEESSSVMVTTSSQAIQAPLPAKNDATSSPDADAADTVTNTMDEMNKMVQRMNQWLQRNWPESYGKKGQLVFHPDMDMNETPADYIIEMDLPGMKKEDIQIEVSNQVLTISGERKKETEETTKEGVHRKERNFGSFQRSIPLADPVKADQVAAEYLDGILTVKIPKAAPAAPKKIKVRIS